MDKVQTDILVVGGGIAGLMAAIQARKAGARVVVAEKADTRRSGAGGMGNDHFRVYLPEYHGTNVEPVIEAYFLSHMGGGGMKHFDAVIPLWLERSAEVAKIWDDWGIPMKHEGKYVWAGHTFPGYPHISLKYHGENQKLILTKKARDQGVEIINRVMVLDILMGNDRPVGALGIHAWEDRLVQFEAKAIILSTGGCSRLYPSLTPGWVFNVGGCPSCTGDGRAMAYRAGAELVNVEMRTRHCGPKYLARSGQATWVGVLRDPQGRPIGTFVDKPDPEWGDPAMEANKGIFAQYRAAGRGPVYMDCGGLSDDDYQHMRHWLVQEGNTTILDYMDSEGIDPRRNPVEFTTYDMGGGGGISINARSETIVNGLYAIGDDAPLGIGACSGAAVHGMAAGENAAKYVKEVGPSHIEKSDRAKKTVAENIRLLDSVRNREDGATWLEFNFALQQTLQDFAANPKSESLLQQGLKHIQRVKARALETLGASNQHELVRSLEVLNLLETAELIFISSLARNETRGLFVRSDYPLPLPMPRQLTIKQVDGRPTTRWEEVRRWRTGVNSANEPF